MNAATLTPADLPIKWQGIAEHTTQRGRTKPVLTGIPGPLFWHHWKHRAEFRAQLKAAMITLQRLERNSWQVVLWINRTNENLVESLGYSVPVVAQQETAIF